MRSPLSSEIDTTSVAVREQDMMKRGTGAALSGYVCYVAVPPCFVATASGAL